MQYYFRAYKLAINIARTFNIIGPGISKSLAIGSFFNQVQNLQEGDSLTVGNIKTKRDYLDIMDVIDAYWKILTSGQLGEIYNVCSGKSISMEDILNLMIQYAQKEIGIAIDESLIRKNDVMDNYGDNSKLINQLGWSNQISLEDSIKTLFE